MAPAHAPEGYGRMRIGCLAVAAPAYVGAIEVLQEMGRPPWRARLRGRCSAIPDRSGDAARAPTPATQPALVTNSPATCALSAPRQFPFAPSYQPPPRGRTLVRAISRLPKSNFPRSRWLQPGVCHTPRRVDRIHGAEIPIGRRANFILGPRPPAATQPQLETRIAAPSPKRRQPLRPFPRCRSEPI